MCVCVCVDMNTDYLLRLSHLPRLTFEYVGWTQA